MIDDVLGDFVQGAVMTVIAVDTGAGVTIARGVGTRRAGEAGLVSLVSRLQWPHLAEHLKAGAPIAITFVAPEDYRCFQLKGEVQEVGPAGEDDCRLASSYIARMSNRLDRLGVPPRPVAAWLCDRDLLRLRYEVRLVYAQTPGPQAGRPLVEDARS